MFGGAKKKLSMAAFKELRQVGRTLSFACSYFLCD